MTVEALNTIFQVGSAVLLGLTFAFGAGAILTGIVISKRQAALIATTGRAVAEANKTAAEAGEGTAKALADVAVANERAAQANERAAHAEQRAAEARLALETFKAPRALSAQEQQLIASRVSKFAGQEYTVTTFWDLKESLNFTNQLHQALQMAGWKYIPPGEGGAFLLGGIAGVQVWIHPDADPKIKDAANALVLALEALGQAPVLKQQNPKNPKDSKINLNIGTKP